MVQGPGFPPLGSVLACSRLGSVCPAYLQHVSSSESPAPCKPSGDLVPTGPASLVQVNASAAATALLLG